MTGNPPTEDGNRTEFAEHTPAREEPAPRTPDESTVALAAEAGPAPAPAAGGRNVPELKVGETLAGRFSIVRFIARGGMGAVYEASDVLLQTRVALKVIQGRIAADATAMARFRREVLLARRVSHPNVCRVYELYEARTESGGPIHFLTMELLEGESLARGLAEKGRMTTQEALPLVRQMCEGLAAAHAEGVIHRDFKSSNVMLVPRTVTEGESTTQSTRVVITDFGVARAVHLAGGEAGDERLTGGAGILGTPEYMAPEQVTGGEVAAAADIYALGVVLYEMVTGKLPFAGDTPLAAAARRLNEPPPRADASVPGLDRRWVEVIARCLARQPERRFRSARDVIPALDLPSRQPRHALPFTLVGIVVLALAAYGLAKYRPSLRLRESKPKTVVTAQRPVVAVLGFRNEVPSPALKWLPTAVTELLAYELSAAESSLCVIPTDQVDLARRSLGVSVNDIGGERPQQRVNAYFGANVLVYGALATTGADDVHLTVHALDGQTRKALWSLDEDLGSHAERLTEAVPRVAARLRTALGADLTEEEDAALSASRVQSLEAAQVYSEGVTHLHRFELEEARSSFEAAVAAEPGLVDARIRVGVTWDFQNDRRKRREALERARALRSGLTSRQAARLDAELLEGRDGEKAREAWTALFEATPDDVWLGYKLFYFLPARAKLSLVRRLQQLPARPALLLDTLEAKAARESGDLQRADELLKRVEVRATELGARWDLGNVRSIQGKILYLSNPLLWQEALSRFRDAERLFAEVGELDNLAGTKGWTASLLCDMGSRGEFLSAIDDAAGLDRRLGDRPGLNYLLLIAANCLESFGEFDAASKKLDEARAEKEAFAGSGDKDLGGQYFLIRARLALASADLPAVEEALRKARGGDAGGASTTLIEGRVRYEQDHREEARSAFSRAASLAGQAGNRLFPGYESCTVDCDGDRPATGLECLAQQCTGRVGLEKAGCLRVEAQCRYRANDLAGAERAALEASPLFGSRANAYEQVFLTRSILMRVAAARGESASAIRALRADLAQVESRHNKPLAFELALALGDVELRAGRPEGRRRLLKLEDEAKSRDFFRIARLAREVLERKPPIAGAPNP